MSSPASSPFDSPSPPLSRSPSVDVDSSLVDDDRLQIFVKNVKGDTTSLKLPSSTSIATLKSLVALHAPSPSTPTDPLPSARPRSTSHSSSLRLLFAGRHLSTGTLSSNNIPPLGVLHLALPLLGGADTASATNPTTTTTTTSSTSTPKKSAKARSRCGFKDCREQAQRIVGDCGFCGMAFCGRHRLLEDHRCSGLEDCKKESRERNAEKLTSERTVVVRGV